MLVVSSQRARKEWGWGRGWRVETPLPRELLRSHIWYVGAHWDPFLYSISSFGVSPCGWGVSEHDGLRMVVLSTWQLAFKGDSQAAKCLKGLSLEWVQHHFCYSLLFCW